MEYGVQHRTKAGRLDASVRLRSRNAVAWALCLLMPVVAWAQEAAPSTSAPSLRQRYATLQPALERSPFRGPVHLASVEGDRTLLGDVHAIISQPFGVISGALAQPEQWCEVLILHLNTKYCRVAGDSPKPQLDLRVGKKFDQPLGAATRVRFGFRTVSSTPDYLAVELQAPEGPFDTRDYRILLEATPLDDGRTFIHMGYSFSYGSMSRMAMQVYLSTIARDKVGFTVADRQATGEPPRYIGGMRGAVERNTMRYYLAIDSYLASMSLPPAERVETRFRSWFDATEKFPTQLREIDRETYLAMKRSEYLRQQTAK